MSNKPQFIKWSQMNGIQCIGETLAVISWDEPLDGLLVRYWYHPDGDPPRKPYTLVHKDWNPEICKKPKGYVPADGEW